MKLRVLHPHKKAVGTHHAFKGGLNGAKIDYIFVSPHIGTLETNIIRISKNGRYPSDHLPVGHTGAISNIYRGFLSQFLPELHKFLKREKLLKKSFFHVSDEPHRLDPLGSFLPSRCRTM